MKKETEKEPEKAPEKEPEKTAEKEPAAVLQASCTTQPVPGSGQPAFCSDQPVSGSMKPQEIEQRSFAIIGEELAAAGKVIPEDRRPVLYRVIHTTADFDYADTLYFSADALRAAEQVFRPGTVIVTDTNMALAGIHKSSAAKLGMECRCFMADPEVAAEAKARGCTRAVVSMERAAALNRPVILAVGNAPTALLRIAELSEQGFRPALVIGVPVGFVNVVQSKERIMETGLPCIVNRGRKGGSNVAAAIVNALLYLKDRTRGENG